MSVGSISLPDFLGEVPVVLGVKWVARALESGPGCSLSRYESL